MWGLWGLGMGVEPSDGGGGTYETGILAGGMYAWSTFGPSVGNKV